MVIELNDADFTSFSNLSVTGSRTGFWIHNDSTNFVGANLKFINNTDNGLTVENDSTGSTFTQLNASNNGGDGIYIASPISSLINSTATGNSGTGINLQNAVGANIQNNILSNNDTGLNVQTYGATTTNIGSANLAAGLGNKIFNNRVVYRQRVMHSSREILSMGTQEQG